MTRKTVLVSGCYDLLHPGHIEFFKQASQYGDLYVCIGKDSTILDLKKHKPVFTESERVFMINAIRYVKEARVSKGDGMMDFAEDLKELKPDYFVVNKDGATQEKKALCEETGTEYIVLERTPPQGIPPRSSSSIKEDIK